MLINNAGISRPEDLTAAEWDIDLIQATIATNITGVLALTGALLPVLRARPDPVVITTTSGLAYVPLAAYPTCSATKAFLHSWLQSLRHQLKGRRLVPTIARARGTGDAVADLREGAQLP